MTPTSFLRTAAITAGAAFVLLSCAKLQDNLPTEPLSIAVHAKGWADTSSTAFHATYLKTHGMRLDSCAACHGATFRGGAARSCAGAGCHNTSDRSPFLFHPARWTDSTRTDSADFHGAFLRALRFPLDSLCAPCHGADFAGGPVATTCSKSGCHSAADNGPLACYNCHGDRNLKTFFPPRAVNGSRDPAYLGVGQHAGHMTDTAVSRRVFGRCSTCHAVPDSFRAAGHIDGARASIVFGDSLAFKRTNVRGGQKYTDTLPTTTPAPHYNAAAGTCENVYCHGTFKNGNATNAPRWTGDEQDACGSCHGKPGDPLPGGSHPKSAACSICHDGTVDDNNKIINPAKHIDGRLNLLGDDYDLW